MVGGNSGTMRECFNSGSVTAKAAGGIAGGVYHLDAYDCYNSGRIEGSEQAGGINGKAGNSNNYTNCYNVGEISGEGSRGSISGSFYTGSITNCYCSESICTTSTAKDAQVIAAEAFTNTASFEGFDFNSTWIMGEAGPMLANVGTKVYGHELVKHDAVAVTCETDGNNEYYTCDYCGTAFKADKVTETTASAEALSATGHNLVKYDASEPACLIAGNNEYYVCSYCGITYRADKKTETLAKYELIPATGHSFPDACLHDRQARHLHG